MPPNFQVKPCQSPSLALFKGLDSSLDGREKSPEPVGCHMTRILATVGSEPGLRLPLCAVKLQAVGSNAVAKPSDSGVGPAGNEKAKR